MLRGFAARGFKSLHDVRIELPRFSVFFGPNAVGKSNLLDALQVLSRLASERTIGDALHAPVRSYPAEVFTFPPGGLQGLLQRPSAEFELEARIETGPAPSSRSNGRASRPSRRHFRYAVTIRIEPATGALSVQDEYLCEFPQNWRQPRGRPRIERDGDHLVVRRRGQGHLVHEPLGLNHTQLSNRRYSGELFTEYDLARAELSSWRSYYLDPRDAMRWPMPPMEVDDIGVSGEMLAPFLYGLQQRHREAFLQFQRVVRSVVPAIGGVNVDLDARRGTLDIQIEQAGTLYSSRVISEGTLRVLALCAIAVGPTPAPLIAYEEPENGVHPARLELVAGLLAGLAARRRSQVLITTHSPLFASTALRLARQGDLEVGLFNVSIEAGASRIERFDVAGPLFDDRELKEALATRDEVQLFEAMLRRGWLDG